ncbi:hypothetical protein ABZP36_010489 [Zizania latifolia]
MAAATTEPWIGRVDGGEEEDGLVGDDDDSDVDGGDQLSGESYRTDSEADKWMRALRGGCSGGGAAGSQQRSSFSMVRRERATREAWLDCAWEMKKIWHKRNGGTPDADTPVVVVVGKGSRRRRPPTPLAPSAVHFLAQNRARGGRQPATRSPGRERQDPSSAAAALSFASAIAAEAPASAPAFDIAQLCCPWLRRPLLRIPCRHPPSTSHSYAPLPSRIRVLWSAFVLYAELMFGEKSCLEMRE